MDRQGSSDSVGNPCQLHYPCRRLTSSAGGENRLEGVNGSTVKPFNPAVTHASRSPRQQVSAQGVRQGQEHGASPLPYFFPCQLVALPAYHVISREG